MEKNKIKGMFVNLLMKHGKKSRALYLLEASVYLFIQSLLKIKIKTFKQPSSIKEKHHDVLQSSPQIRNSTRAYKNGGTGFFGSLYMLSNKVGSPLRKGGNVQSIDQPMFSESRIFVKENISNILEKNPGDVSCITRGQVARVDGNYDIADLRDIFPFFPKFSSVFLEFYAYQCFDEKAGRTTIHSATVKKFLLDFHIILETQNQRAWPLRKPSEGSLARVLHKVFAQERLEKGLYFSLKKPVPKLNANNAAPRKSWYGSSRNAFCLTRYTEAQKNTHLHYLYTAISNVKPPLECKSKRFGGSNRQIPATVSENRQWGTAISWIIEAALYQKNKKKAGSAVPLHSKQLQAMHDRRSEHGTGTSIVQDHTRFSKSQKLGKATLNTLSTFRQQACDRKSHEHSEKHTQARQQFSFSQEKKGFAVSAQKRQQSVTLGSEALSLQSTQSKNTLPLFCHFLAEALQNAYYKRGSAVDKRDLWVDTAVTNRAYLRDRWW